MNLFRKSASSSRTGKGAPTIEKIVYVTRKTPLEGLVQKMNSRAQAQFYLEHNNISFKEYDLADQQYQTVRAKVQRREPSGVKVQWIDRDLLPTYQFGERDLVVTLGQDGLVVNVAKYLTTQPILAVNPDPARFDGILTPFRADNYREQLDKVLAGDYAVERLSMVQATLNDGQVLYGVNDLFIGPRSHGSARYLLQIGGRQEAHSSSGIIVSTGVGCSGWLRSITTGAWHIAQYFYGGNDAPPDLDDIALGWQSEKLWYTVREPFISRTSQANIVFGQLGRGEEMVITSQMPDYGVIFSDGIEADYVTFNSGAVARVGLADRRAHLVVPT
jgi:NAD kinase